MKNRISVEKLLLAFLTLAVFFILQFSYTGVDIHIDSMIIMIFLFILLNKNLKLEILNNFLNIYIYFLIPSLILYILIAAGTPIEWDKLIPINNTKAAQSYLYYREYPGMIVISTLIFPFGSGEIFRLSGVFDEPGVIGTLSAVLLVVFNSNLTKFKRTILIVSGMLSFSLFFFIVIILFLVYKKPKLFMVVFLSIVVLFGLFNKQVKQNELVYRYIIERLSDPSHIDNRTSQCFEENFSQMLLSNSAILGKGQNAAQKLNCDVSSWKTIVYNHGILGFGLIVIFYTSIFLHLLNKSSKKRILDFFFILLIFILAMYQRPGFNTIWYFTLFYGAFLLKINANNNLLSNKTKGKNENLNNR